MGWFYLSDHLSVLFFLLFSILYKVGNIHALGSNAEIEENELGLTARACASNFCHNKDSLVMWLDLEWYCHAPEELIPTGFLTLLKSTDAYALSPFIAGMFCALLGILGFMIGFCIGMKIDRLQLVSEKNSSSRYYHTDNGYHEKSSFFGCFDGKKHRRPSSKGASYIRRSDYSQLPTADAVPFQLMGEGLVDLPGYHTQS